MNNKQISHMQLCVNMLEDYKRYIGRQYDKVKRSNTYETVKFDDILAMYRDKYNTIEDLIAWAVATQHCVRRSKPYKLEA